MSKDVNIESIRFLHSGPLAPIKRWGAKWSLWAVHLVTACCGVELAHTYASGYDAERWGSLNFGMMRQTNLIIVEGAISKKMARALRITWEQMPEPKFVIVMGACGIEGGLFWNSYHIARPSEIVPVDYYIPGCPPTPEALIRAIRALQKKIEKGEAKTTAEYAEVKLEDVLEIKEVKERKPPKAPLKLAPKPEIKIEPKEVDWEFGNELVSRLSEKLGGLGEVFITGVNRIYIKTTKERFVRVAEILSEDFDHVKSVNVIDLIHENRFVIEYTVSSYSVKELMSVLVTISAEIPRDNPKFPSLINIWPSADYQEREMYDFFGVWFEGNPWMGNKFLIAPEVETPLRKDFKIPQPNYVLGGES
ncbi:NADH-quinone oxidoreductase subunit NuoB [Archaeoglobus veneficus]|uniref:NADH-quinone oxidoreductase, B subunit n=1 Tax=Archaeoglobus veneficus (strain DSM 11195 / SNP6) TaxID=693661 RepID=F2KQC0_ARCVS|nr:NADH-quinone oxidoreductase subunit NuoB [Archaeoglobus veneficus]AEA46553.1 NADH-quinone oxidoreductase, B subunit [Archaeoglobus veneficus SNP6]